jgi:hypothetical protein
MLHSSMTPARVVVRATWAQILLVRNADARTKGTMMNKLLNQIQGAARTRAAYRRTLSEIQQMPLDVALDLGIDRTAAERIAHIAVYGR